MGYCVSLDQRDQLERLLDEHVDDGQREAVEDHVEGCLICQRTLEELAAAQEEAPARRQPPPYLSYKEKRHEGFSSGQGRSRKWSRNIRSQQNGPRWGFDRRVRRLRCRQPCRVAGFKLASGEVAAGSAMADLIPVSQSLSYCGLCRRCRRQPDPRGGEQRVVEQPLRGRPGGSGPEREREDLRVRGHRGAHHLLRRPGDGDGARRRPSPPRRGLLSAPTEISWRSAATRRTR